MSERWKKIQEQTKQQWRQHAPAELQQRVQTWQDNRVLTKLEFSDYTEKLTISQQEFAASRQGLITHVREVIQGHGGKTIEEAGARTTQWIENLGQHFMVVASQLTTADTHPYTAARNMTTFLTEDHTIRRQKLMSLRGASYVRPARVYELSSIVYSYADPTKEWLEDETLANAIETMPREEAAELYKQIVAEQIDSAIKFRRPMTVEQSNPNSALKAAAIGLGLAAVTSVIFGSKQSRTGQ